MADNTSRRTFIVAAGTGMVATLSGCLGDDLDENGGGGGSGGDDADVEEFDDAEVGAAFVFDGRIGDNGWSAAHERSRQIIDEENDWLQTAMSENVSEVDAPQIMAEYVRQEYDIIFTTSVTFQDTTLEAAEQHTDTYFSNGNGFNMADNMGRYNAKIYEARYLAGVAAGLVTETDRIGHLGGFPVPLAYRDINAFTLGARSVNPDVRTEVRWMNSWYDPPGAREAVQSLLDNDVDAVASHLDSPAGPRAASDGGAWSSGWASSMADQVEEKYLTGPVIHWENYYGPIVEEIYETGEWDPGFVWGDMADGVVVLDEYGDELPDDVIDEVEAAKEGILDGSLNVWEGSQFEDADEDFIESQMDEFVDGVGRVEEED